MAAHSSPFCICSQSEWGHPRAQGGAMAAQGAGPRDRPEPDVRVQQERILIRGLRRKEDLHRCRIGGAALWRGLRARSALVARTRRAARGGARSTRAPRQRAGGQGRGGLPPAAGGLVHCSPQPHPTLEVAVAPGSKRLSWWFRDRQSSRPAVRTRLADWVGAHDAKQATSDCQT